MLMHTLALNIPRNPHCKTTTALVVFTPGKHLFARGPENKRVLKLGGVAALDVAERGVGVDDAHITQVLQRHQVLGLPQAVQPATTEGQRAEVGVDDVQQLLGLGQPVKGGKPFASLSL